MNIDPEPISIRGNVKWKKDEAVNSQLQDAKVRIVGISEAKKICIDLAVDVAHLE